MIKRIIIILLILVGVAGAAIDTVAKRRSLLNIGIRRVNWQEDNNVIDANDQKVLLGIYPFGGSTPSPDPCDTSGSGLGVLIYYYHRR